MGNSFFSELKGVVETVSAGKFKNEVVKTIKNLDAFIRSGVLSGSKNDRFILQYYDQSVPKITKKWNKINSKTKSENTFRCQKGLLSNYVASVFDLSPNELFNALNFDTEDKKKVFYPNDSYFWVYKFD